MCKIASPRLFLFYVKSDEHEHKIYDNVNQPVYSFGMSISNCLAWKEKHWFYLYKARFEYYAQNNANVNMLRDWEWINWFNSNSIDHHKIITRRSNSSIANWFWSAGHASELSVWLIWVINEMRKNACRIGYAESDNNNDLLSHTHTLIVFEHFQILFAFSYKELGAVIT